MKGFWKNSIVGFILKNILAAAVLVAAGVWITFRAIDKYTEHGVAEKVPDLRGAYMAEAEVLLAAQELYPQIIDSVYMRDKRLGTIVDQTPCPAPPSSTTARCTSSSTRAKYARWHCPP